MTTTHHPTDALPLPELPTTSYLGDGNGYGYVESDMQDYARAARREGYELAMIEIASLRFMLAVRVAGAALYGDDGELQDNSTRPHIDFKRDSVEEIERKLLERGARRFVQDMDALAAPAQEQPTMTPEQVRDGIADYIEFNCPHREYWTPDVAELVRSIEIKPHPLRTPPAQQQAGSADVSALRGENAVLLGLLTDCAAVMRTIDPDDSDEADKLSALLSAINRAQAPSRHKGELL